MDNTKIEDGRDDDSDLVGDCDQCGKHPVVADVGGHNLCADCAEEYD